jgi:hypothetical protein
MLSEMDNKTYVRDNNITVEKYLREWLNTYIIPHKSPTTIESYNVHVEKYIIPQFGSVKLQELTLLPFRNGITNLLKSLLAVIGLLLLRQFVIFI